ncbi:MAG TPA: peptidyl-prolyl cis-trans isomerase [Bryobacteraceae bacterium]|nr:peptidyl-prolyl cis-trans isomerase [Bryobacteraceae bacterium]
MFDLFRSRDKAVRILLGALLLVVALSMLTYLVPSYNTGASLNDTVVAEVGKEPIGLVEVQRLIQNTMRGRQLPPDILPNFIPQMVDNMISDRALAYEAQKLGFEVTDAEVADAIRQFAPSLFPDGKFVGTDMYAGFLQQQNLTIAEFEADVKRQLLISRMRDVALEGTIVTPFEIEQEYRKKNEKVKIEYVKISSDKYKAEVQPSAADMQAYFKTNAARYTVPEKRNLAILIADQAKLEQTVTIPDAGLQRAYTQNLNQYRMPETVKMEHVLLMTQGKPSSDEPAIKAKADDLLKQVRANANFADLVKKYSEDPGASSNQGVYEVQRDSQMMPEFKEAAFRLKPGESEVVKTAYGYHVVKVIQHDQPRVKPFEEVKGEIASQLKKQRVNDLMEQVSDKAPGLLQKDPMHPEKVAADLNIQLVRADNYESGKPLPDVGPSPDFDQALTGLKKGEVSQPVAIQGNKIVLAVVTDVIPPRPMTFEEAQSQVRDAMVQNRLATAVQDHAKELMDKAKAMGDDLAKAAKAMGLEVKTSAEFTRSGSVEGLGSASYFQEAFGRPDGSLIGPVSVTDATVIGKVVAHLAPDMSKLPEERASIRDELKSQKAQNRYALFQSGITDLLVKQGVIKYHQDVINRLITSYKTSS